jgi:hypothetical protein
VTRSVIVVQLLKATRIAASVKNCDSRFIICLGGLQVELQA